MVLITVLDYINNQQIFVSSCVTTLLQVMRETKAQMYLSNALEFTTRVTTVSETGVISHKAVRYWITNL